MAVRVGAGATSAERGVMVGLRIIAMAPSRGGPIHPASHSPRPPHVSRPAPSVRTYSETGARRSACSWLPRSLSGPVEGVDVAGGRPVEAGQGPGQRPPVVLVQRVPETQGGGEEDELRHREVRVLEGALGAPPMAKYVSHGSRAGATARPHFGVDKFILRRPDEHCLRASDPVHEPAPPRSLSHRPRPPVDTLPGRNGRLVLTSRSLPSGCQVNCTFRTSARFGQRGGRAVRRRRVPRSSEPTAAPDGQWLAVSRSRQIWVLPRG
jgi:hypothetical protein